MDKELVASIERPTLVGEEGKAISCLQGEGCSADKENKFMILGSLISVRPFDMAAMSCTVQKV